jgi:hypothetical protein
MMKPTQYPVIVLLCSLLLMSSSPSPEDLQWNEYRPLKWEDFQGEININSLADAATAVTIRADGFKKKGKIYYQVNSVFHKRRSWYRKKSVQLLRHEQLHFDIAELYARRIRKTISELQRKDVSDVRQYKNAIEKLLEESNRIDQAYDNKTIHGIDLNRQRLWEKNIHDQLDSYSSYSAPNWKNAH